MITEIGVASGEIEQYEAERQTYVVSGVPYIVTDYCEIDTIPKPEAKT